MNELLIKPDVPVMKSQDSSDDNYERDSALSFDVGPTIHRANYEVSKLRQGEQIAGERTIQPLGKIQFKSPTGTKTDRDRQRQSKQTT